MSDQKSDQETKVYDFKAYNEKIREELKTKSTLTLEGVCGQRYIGSAMKAGKKLVLKGVPGNDLGCYMDGGEIDVIGNAQDATGNTMNEGKIVIHGNCGDTAGYAMRGGQILIKGNAGCRIGIHMKEYFDKIPEIVIGGEAGDFLGEYMAGGTLLVLGIGSKSLLGRFSGTGLHGGRIILRGKFDKSLISDKLAIVPADEEDMKIVKRLVGDYCKQFGCNEKELMNEEFTKVYALDKRPYGNMYVGC